MDTLTAPRHLRLHASDNVVVAVDSFQAGQKIEGVTVADRVPRGHKLASRVIAEGEPVRKFGQIIGSASKLIEPGQWVHEHNLNYSDFVREADAGHAPHGSGLLPLTQRATFEGFRRANGRAGTRNYIGVLTSVNCSASVARFIAEAVRKSGLLDEYPTIDGIIPLVHGGGCAMDTNGEGYEVLKRTQWGYATNPNIGAVLMVGLGCEAFQIGRWKETYNIVENDTFRSLTIQEVGGTRKTMEAGIAAVRDMLPVAANVRRETIPASELMLALQCGGSDGYSGITANPALGAAVDLLVKHGGTAILSETPEIYGAEHLLIERASNPQAVERLQSIIAWWEDYTARNKMEMNNNPSPGNKAGGLTTILEKSLGAVAKSGTSPLEAVYGYAEPITSHGLVFMDTPGYDPVSATGQVAGGANVLAFTTGRGSAYGCKPTPSIKLATNTPMYNQMIEDMDINCGDILDGVSIEAKGQEIFERVLKVASGAPSKSEQLGYGDAEFVPWQIGATM
ncbi:altronate dehydratase family protein [Phyllobacterium sp. UNC302MFCol5.2]|uniref:UxaA family hydrolase n=1 Tax=Phyllobacterium sp. UNC302MFCol5.2 TaxID=1449065 RepID=UPI0004831789|nr:altronate dehydratase family protein [Phyllobacterium sp. UNC302MFCol5.2]